MLAPRGAIAKDGDVVLLYRGHGDITPLQLTAGEVLHCREGKFSHNDLIGQPLGHYVAGRSNRRDDPSTPSILMLQMSADLWTQAVPHRTQIIYDTDIAVIIFNLRLQPGKVVIEAGTGSGSLTHALAKTVAPTGRVVSCDFHRARCLAAREEFRRHGLTPSLVCSRWRDVCTTNTEEEEVHVMGSATSSSPALEGDNNNNNNMSKNKVNDDDDDDVESWTEPRTGFGMPASSADAVFLDVPAPWAAIDNVRHVLREGGMLCTFSPCIEQVQRTVDALRTEPYDFIDVRTVEALTQDFSPAYRKRSRSAATEEDATTTACVRGGGGRLLFQPNVVSKGHSAYLTFCRRRRGAEDASSTTKTAETKED